MSEELMITQQDLIDWIDRPPSNDDLDLATFISTRLENFCNLEEQLQQKENIIKEVREYIENHSITNIEWWITGKQKIECKFMKDTNPQELLEILDKPISKKSGNDF